MLLNLRPSGKYLMEDFFYAGGLPVVLKELLPLLHGDAPTVTGQPRWPTTCATRQLLQRGRHPPARHADRSTRAALAMLTGNLCPDGAVIKLSAASPHLLTHRGRAVVFEDHADLHARIDDPDLAIDETSVLVLKHVGPKGAPGMPEWGAAPIPRKLLQKGVRDMVRISDARMSGTSYGTVVAARRAGGRGGRAARARAATATRSSSTCRTARLTLRVPDDGAGAPPARSGRRGRPHFTRGYGRLFLDHVLQAHEGCDFDFLRGKNPGPRRGHRRPQPHA